MWTTETEARERWCPQARTFRREEINPRDPIPVTAVVGGINRARVSNDEPSFPASCRCYASACMLWRWEPSKYKPDRASGWLTTTNAANLIRVAHGAPTAGTSPVQKRHDRDGRVVFNWARGPNPDIEPQQDYVSKDDLVWAQWVEAVGRDKAENIVRNSFLEAGVEVSVSIGRGTAREHSLHIVVYRAIEPIEKDRRGYCGLAAKPVAEVPA